MFKTTSAQPEAGTCPLCGSPRFLTALLSTWASQDWPKKVTLNPAFIRDAKAVDGPNPIVGYCLGCTMAFSRRP